MISGIACRLRTGDAVRKLPAPAALNSRYRGFSLALTMSAQDFHGVTVSGAGGRYTIANHSTKPLIGYALQGRTTAGLRPVFGYVHTAAGLKPISGRVDFGSVAAGKPMQPGEERHVAMISGFTRSTEEVVRVLTTVIDTGTAQGFDKILLDFWG
jgi:hypothetical protein